MDFFLILFLTLLNGVFAMSEMALAASRKSRLTAMSEGGDRGAQTALDLLENPTQFLSSVQVGITSIGMLNGILGEAAFSGALTLWLHSWGLSERIASISATAVVVSVITFLTIVFGELVPKRIGQLYPELVARWVAPPMKGVATIAKPFVRLLALSTRLVLKCLRIDESSERPVTEEEISASLNEGLDAGVIEAHEHKMVLNVFRLDDRPLTSLMIPRSDIVWLDASWNVQTCLSHLHEPTEPKAHSWYPVCRGSLDDVVGIISLSHLLRLNIQNVHNIEAQTEAATFMPETLSGLELLEQFRAKTVRMVFVVDEYGVVQGLMTPRDLLEAITGELHTSVTADAWAVAREDGSWLLDGLMPIEELKQRLNIRELPQEDRGLYNTLAGLLLFEFGHLPKEGECIECSGWLFEVVDLDGMRIDKIFAIKN